MSALPPPVIPPSLQPPSHLCHARTIPPLSFPRNPTPVIPDIFNRESSALSLPPHPLHPTPPASTPALPTPPGFPLKMDSRLLLRE